MRYWNPETKEFTKSPVRDAEGEDISLARLWRMWTAYWFRRVFREIAQAWRDRP